MTLSKYLEQKNITGLLFSSSLYTIFSSIEEISWDESSRLLYGIPYYCMVHRIIVWYTVFSSFKDIVGQRNPPQKARTVTESYGPL